MKKDIFGNPDVKHGAVLLVLGLLFTFWIIPWQVPSVAQESEVMLPSFFPKFGGLLLMVLSSILLAKGLLVRKKGEESSLQEGKERLRSQFHVMRLMLLSVCYYFMISLIGFLVASIIVIPLCIFLLGERNWKLTIIIGVAISLLVYVSFSVLMKIPFPQGTIFSFY